MSLLVPRSGRCVLTGEVVRRAPFVETIKSSEPITTVLLAFVLLGETETALSYVCLLPIVGGVALASMGDMSFSALAFAVVQVSNLGFSGRAVFVKQLKSGRPARARLPASCCRSGGLDGSGGGRSPLLDPARARALEGVPLRQD